MGKTAFAINITRYIINQDKSYVMLFSLEMSTEQLLRRILAQECHLNSQKIQSGRLSDDDWEYVIRKCKNLADLNLYIEDNANISSDTIKTKVKLFRLQEKKIKLIIIDYLQLLQYERQSDNRSQELSLITRSLKILAKDLNLPILVLSQLNRNLETRSDKRPLLSDLRESGCVSRFNYIKTPVKSGNRILFNCYYKHVKVLNFNDQKIKLFMANDAKISRTGKKPTYKITTQSGKFIKLTNNHKLLTAQGWKRCDEINQNNMLATQINTSEKKYTSFNCFLLLTFEDIENINVIRLEAVFDLSCKSLYNFIANNFIVHNSIEQDADLVIMLYRESYYSKDNKEEDLTEVIVAKHRNGPIGTFQLKFNSQLASFSNLKNAKNQI
nr:replication helicase subunit [Pyropia sp. Myanmar_A]BED43358.1 replication helicase subunit [Pyropia sp. Myanmar_B]BED43555.1 replication helicase subunit [Pyropia sp. Myanmar_C]